MAYAYVKTVYAGTNVITLPFSYLSTNDVYLWVNDVLRPQSEITWTSSSIVTITTSGLTAGDVILIARVTNIASSNVVYSNDTQLTKDNLNNANKQLLYLNQETRDVTTLANSTASTSMAAQVAAASASAVSAASSASAASSSATTASNASTAAQGYATSAENSKDAAYDSELAAAASEGNAAISEGNAEVYKNQAVSSASTASTKATEAAASAAAALVSEGNAAASETAAGISETNAGVSEDNAAQSAIDAAASAASVDLPGIFTYIKTVDGAGSGLDADLLDGNEATAFATAAHNHTGTYQPMVYRGTVATAAADAAKACTISGYTSATVGALFAITFTLGNTVAAMTLNINGLGAVGLRVNGVATSIVTATLAANATLLLYFDGTYLQLMGSQRVSDADTVDRMLWSNAVTAGITLYSYKLMMQGSDGKFYPLTLETGTGTTKTVSTVEFNIESPVLYYNSTTTVTTNAATSATVVYSEYPITSLTYTFNQATWTAQLPIYLKGTITAAGRFKLDNTSYTSWATQTLPTTEDGFVYMLLGHTYSTTAMRLFESHPLVEYKGSKLRTYIADGVASGLNADKLDGYHIDDIVTYVAGSFAPASHVSDTAAHGAVSTNTASKIVTRDASGNFAAGTISANLTGTATSSTYASQLLNSRTFNVSGDITGTATSFNGTANITIPATLTKVRAGTHAFRRLGNSGGTDNITITAANGTATISFSVSSYAIGSGSAAALFTAPVTGLYHFDVCLRFLSTTNAATGLACGLQTPTNLFYGTCPIPDGTVTGDLFTCNVSIDEYLTAAGTVAVSALKLGAGSCVVDVGASWWSGHLVYAA